jgi:beta-lactamase regulating signal transducer with metallopeptidase domain
MTNLLNHLALAWWQWMWPMFWQTSLLIAVVAAADLLVRRWAWSQVRYALWLLVLVKLVLPPSLASPASVAGALWGRNAAARPAVAVAVEPAETRMSLPAMPTDPTSLAERAAGAAGTAAAMTIAPVAVPRTPLAWQVYPMAVWFVGVVVLGAWVTARFRGLRREYLRESRRSVAQSPSAVNPTVTYSPDSGAFTAEGDCATSCGPFPEHALKTEVGTGAEAEESGPDGFAEALRGAAAQLRLRRLPAVVFSPRVQSPAVFGLWRPVLVMPAEEPGKEEAGEDAPTTMPASLRHVLLHELAHIKRGDLHVLSFCILLQVLYWFHPLLWLVRRRLQHLRELCCDATVAGLLREETPHYRATLVEAARRLLAPPSTRDGLGLLGLIEQPGNLIERLRRLEGKVWRHARLRFAVVVLVVAAMCVAVVPMVQSQPKERSPKKGSVSATGNKGGPTADSVRMEVGDPQNGTTTTTTTLASGPDAASVRARLLAAVERAKSSFDNTRRQAVSPAYIEQAEMYYKITLANAPGSQGLEPKVAASAGTITGTVTYQARPASPKQPRVLTCPGRALPTKYRTSI